MVQAGVRVGAVGGEALCPSLLIPVRSLTVAVLMVVGDGIGRPVGSLTVAVPMGGVWERPVPRPLGSA